MSGNQTSASALAGKRETTYNAILDATNRLITEQGIAGFTRWRG